MLRKMLACVLALLLAVPALAQSDEIQALEERIEQLEAENAELRELLSQEASGRLLAARFEGGVITVSEAKAEYESRAYYYEQLGMDPSEYEDVTKDEVLRDLTEDAILALKAQELGVYEPSEEEEAQIRESAQQSLDEMIDYYLSFQADPAKSDEENRAAVEEFLAQEGTTLESLMENINAQSWRDRLKQAVTGDIQITDEQLRAYYEEACSSAELTYTADPQSYESDRLNGEAVLWNPMGYRRVKRLLFAFSDEDTARMAQLTQQLEDTSDLQAVSAALEEIDALYATLTPTVETALARLRSGDDFDMLLDEYGADPYMSGIGRDSGYYVSADSTLLDAQFVSEAMALENPGDVSGPIECEDGIYILRYEGEVIPGAVSYDEFLADETMRADVEESVRSQAYNVQVEQWLDEAGIELYPENF